MEEVRPVVKAAKVLCLVENDLIHFCGSKAREEPIWNENARSEEADDAGAVEALCATDFKRALGLARQWDFDWSCGAPKPAQAEDMKNEICGACGGGDKPESGEDHRPAGVELEPGVRRDGNSDGGRAGCRFEMREEFWDKRQREDSGKGAGPKCETVACGDAWSEFEAQSERSCDGVSLPQAGNDNRRSCTSEGFKERGEGGEWHGSGLPRSVGICCGNRVFETLKLVGGETFVAENGKQEPFARIAEEAVQDVTDLGAARLVLGNAGPVDEGATLLPMLDVPFLFKDANGCEHGVVGQRFAVGQVRNQISDGRFSTAPQDFHEPELGLCQRI